MGKQAKGKRMRGSARMDPMAASGKAGGSGGEGSGGEGMGEVATAEMTGQIVSELGDMSAERRAKAAHAVAGVAATGMIGLQALLRMGVVGRLTRLLCDSSLMVRSAAASALRNAGIQGGDAAYAAIVDADVMTPLLASIQQVGALLSTGEDTKDETVELACILLDLLWELCESSVAAVERFNAAGPAFPTSLAQLVCPPLSTAAPSVAASAAQCLHVLSEDNPQTGEIFKANPAALAAIHGVIADPSTPHLVSSLCAGTILNLGPEFRPADLPASLHRIFSAAMSQDHMEGLPQALSQVHAAATGALEPTADTADAGVNADDSGGAHGHLPGGQQEDKAAGMGGDEGERRTGAVPGVAAAGKQQKNLKAITYSKFKEQFLHTEVDAAEKVRQEMDRWSKRVTLSQIALQILANMLLSQVEELDDEEGSEGWESCDDEEGMEEETGNSAEGEGDADIAAWAMQTGLVQSACALCQYPPSQVLEAVSAVGEPALPAFESICAMQVNALDCISNWVACAPETANDQVAAVGSTVLGSLCTLSPLLFSQMPAECHPLLKMVDEGISGLASAYLRRSGVPPIPPSVHDSLARWVQPGCDGATRSNSIFCLGALGKVERGAAANGTIGGLLLGVVQTSNDVVAASEALGGIYDCYAEDDVNQTVLAPMGMLPALSAIQAPFLAASKQWLQDAKAGAKKDPEVRRRAALVREARANLPRFIAYKKEMGLAC